MKYMKRLKIYKGRNVTFNPETFEAFSYGWWRFVDQIDGLVVFNNYRYSVTTAKHQRWVGGLMENLGIKIDITMPLPRGISRDQTLEEMILEAEEHLCDVFLENEIRKQEKYERAKQRKAEKRLEDYLENQVNFRDYDIRPKSQFRTLNIIAVHQLVERESLERDVENALHAFRRDGFSKVVFYV